MVPNEILLDDPADKTPGVVYPEEVKAMLRDPNLDQGMKDILELQAKVTGSFFAQSLGGVYKQNLEGIPSWSKPRATSAIKAKYDFARKSEPNAIRNEVNVSVPALSDHRRPQLSSESYPRNDSWTLGNRKRGGCRELRIC